MECPRCRHDLYKSHTRGLGEWAWKRLVGRRPYRCRACGWRGLMDGQRPPLDQRTTRRLTSLAVIAAVVGVAFMFAAWLVQ